MSSLRDFWLQQRSDPQKFSRSDPVVLRSEVHLLRNFKNFPFPEQLSPAERRELSGKIGRRVRRTAAFRQALCCDLCTLDEEEHRALREWKHLTSLEVDRHEGSYLLLGKDGVASLWLCGEHHLVWNLLGKNLCLEKLWQRVSRWATALEDWGYAFSPLHGYLAADAEDWGSGLHASVILHLPAIQENGFLEAVLATLPPLGLQCTPEYPFVALEVLPVLKIFHDGSSPTSPEEALRVLRESVLLIAERERGERCRLSPEQRLRIRDRVGRAWGVLSTCRLLGAAEALCGFFQLRLGACLGWLPEDLLPRLDHHARHLPGGTFRAGLEARDLSKLEEDAARARYVQQFVMSGNFSAPAVRSTPSRPRDGSKRPPK